MYKFRELSPKRTFKQSYNNYRKYKEHLVKDFNNRCGYTDCTDFWFGGKNNFHIDHFLPKSKHPKLANDYSNLVYCCSYVNILKSDDEGNYLDPCNVDFNKHFERDSDGSIIPNANSKKAKYMYSRLNLGLSRYRVIWLLDKMISTKRKLLNEIESTSNEYMVSELKEAYFKISIEFDRYIDYLQKSQ